MPASKSRGGVETGFKQGHPYTGGDGQGYGVFLFESNNSKYEGEWKDNRYDGNGKTTLSTGLVAYDGEWKEGKCDGAGKFQWASGATYEGEWKAGTMEGKGTYRLESGNVYTGEWKGGQRHGWGKHIIAVRPKVSSEYEGEWVDDQRIGRGTLTYPNGEAEVGTFAATNGETEVGTGRRAGEGARWSADRQKAWRMKDGKEVNECTLEEAAAIAAAIDLPVPAAPAQAPAA